MDKTFFDQRIQSATHPLPGDTPRPTHYRLPVKQKYEGYNVIDFFLEVVPRSTREIWENKIETQNLHINGKPAQKNSILKGGYITEHRSEPRTEPKVANDISLLYCDANLLVINKPAPLPMHPSGRFNYNSLTEILKRAFPEEDLKIIHRLDANTTGIVVLARNKEIIPNISAQFENKSAQKKYIALVEGSPKKNHFSTGIKIGLEKTAGGGRAKNKKGVEAYTEFNVLERYATQTLLEVTPHTGRTNQIRLHLASLDLPIVGDYGYQDPTYFRNNPLTYPEDCLFLHAWQLKLQYQNSEITFEAPIPSKFKKN